MSAIAGLWRRRGGPDPTAGCQAMLAAQAIFGPHDGAAWSDGEAALGRRLFRLLPEDDHDRQPLIIADGAVLVADLRLDNRPELEGLLDIAADRATRLCDAAILAAAWERWGEDCFDRLVGDYAFAVWDGRSRRLVLARDPCGHRPLYFSAVGEQVAFASLPRGLAAIAEARLSPDEDRMAHFLALAPETGPASFYAGVERVEPGCLAIFHQGRPVRRRRHFAPAPAVGEAASIDAWAARLRALTEQAVAARLRRAGGRLGAHLSSGLDSGIVAATAAVLEATAGGGVLAFTAAPREGYDHPAPRGCHADEAPGAALVAAAHPNMEHVVVRGGGAGLFDSADRASALAGRPVLNPCNQGWWDEISRAAAARGARVLLTGDFGNLTLTPDGRDLLASLAAAGRWRTWLGHARALARGGDLGWPAILAVTFEDLAPAWAWTLLRRASGRGPERPADAVALRPGLRARLARRAARRGAGAQAAAEEPRLAGLGRIDLGAFNKATLAAFGIDIRHPATDRRLLEFALCVPPEVLLADGRLRGLARRAFADLLPPAAMDARGRGWQGADWHETLTAARSEVASEIERLAVLPAAARLLDIGRLRRLARRWPRGGWERDEVVIPYRLALLRALSAGRFLRQALGANA